MANKGISKFPEYDEELVQRIREWCELGRFERYERYTRAIPEYLCELGYLIVLQQLEIRNLLKEILSRLEISES